MKARFLIQTEDTAGFADRMRAEGIGLQVLLDQGLIVAVLEGWEVIWLARHYPPHTLAAQTAPGKTGQPWEYGPPLAPLDSEVPATVEELAAAEEAEELEADLMALHAGEEVI